MAFLDDNRNNYNQGYYDVEKDQFINYANISIPYNTLIQIMKYTLTHSKLINVTNIKRLDKFLNNINADLVYNESQQNQKNVFLIIKEIVKVRLEESIERNEILIEHLIEQFQNKMSSDHLREIVNIMSSYLNGGSRQLSEREIDSLNTYIKERYAALEIYKNANVFKYVYDKLTTDRISPNELVQEISKPLSEVNKIVKQTANVSSSTKNNFVNFLEADNAVEVVADSIDKLRNPANKLKTGFKMLNRMFNGGFENGRVYSFFGTPKSFKSGTLLNMVMSVALANKADQIKTLDPNKIPVIYYLTMENSMSESLDRMYEYVMGHSMSESDQSPEECVNELNKYSYEKTGINFVVEYRKNNEVSTDYLYEVYEQLEDEGYQVIMVVQDYLKRIRASDHIEDLRIRLGAISDEFTVFAKEKEIPVVTAAQLNRQAYVNVEKAISENKSDIAKQLDRSQIAESAMIIENIDYGVIINRENSKEKSQDDYLSFKLIASRGKMGEERIEYFAQPFDNSFKLAVDVDTPELKGVESIGSNLENTKNSNDIRNDFTNQAKNLKSKTDFKKLKNVDSESYNPYKVDYDF